MTGKSACDTFNRKFRNFRKDPLGSCARKLLAWSNRLNPEFAWKLGIYFRPVYQQWAAHQLRRCGYRNFLALRPLNAIPPDFADLWFLYQSVRSRQPRYILEFGSGCSTIILAQALLDNQGGSPKSRGFLYTLEADPYWADVTIKSIPPHLRGLIEILHSPLLEVEYQGTDAFRYSEIPDVVPDFAYLDGPALTPDRRVAVDLLDIEDRFPTGFYLIVDGRWENTEFLRKHLRKNYLFRYRRLFHNSIFELIT